MDPMYWLGDGAVFGSAVLGTQCGYVIGRRVGPALFKEDDSRFVKKRYPASSHEFFGNFPFVSRHIELIVMVIAVASAVPVIASAAAAFIRRRQAVEGR
jgi:membrane-associated protein